MKVRELIEELQKMNPELEVFTNSFEPGGYVNGCSEQISSNRCNSNAILLVPSGSPYCHLDLYNKEKP